MSYMEWPTFCTHVHTPAGKDHLVQCKSTMGGEPKSFIEETVCRVFGLSVVE